MPAPWRARFRGARRVLASHRGWDPGALGVARAYARELGTPLVASTISRLFVELNRSERHPALFSEWMRDVPAEERATILDRWWRPHRAEVEARVRRAVRDERTIVHIAVHTFTPVWEGKRRPTEVGLLFDPRRGREAAWCRAWQRGIVRAGFVAHRNRPYRGWTDGLTTHLRSRFPDRCYLGIELEIRQDFFDPGGRAHRGRGAAIASEILRAMPRAIPETDRRAST
ncbi:MAG: N-formylglutamate amidohydrolase [Gemmatimonadetes bacterium]|nr:N-formylglutamate amidohydrolase [Gemmatimonadota bacterium]